MKTRKNYYEGLAADYSRPGLVNTKLAKEMIAKAEQYIAMKENKLPTIDERYPKEQVEAENKNWWPTHCEALRQGNSELLSAEYREDLVYLCQDGPFYSRASSKDIESSWWTLLSQPGVTMSWPIVMFSGEVVYFEWRCVDDITNETTAKGNVTFIRRGHRGGVWLKTEQLTFYRDVNKRIICTDK